MPSIDGDDGLDLHGCYGAMNWKLASNRAETLGQKRGFERKVAFTLVELLVVIAVISMLTAILLPVLSKAKARAYSIRCKNNEHHMGLALNMYLVDYHAYPEYMQSWSQELLAYFPKGTFISALFTNGDGTTWSDMVWNPEYQCPAIKVAGVRTLIAQVNYAYNAYGIEPWGLSPWPGGSAKAPYLGLSGNPFPTAWDIYWPSIRDSNVKVPAEMYAIGDARAISDDTSSMVYLNDELSYGVSWGNGMYGETQIFRHGKGFNFLFCDGHVQLVSRTYFTNLPSSSPNWNNDHQPHSERWLGR